MKKIIYMIIGLVMISIATAAIIGNLPRENIQIGLANKEDKATLASKGIGNQIERCIDYENGTIECSTSDLNATDMFCDEEFCKFGLYQIDAINKNDLKFRSFEYLGETGVKHFYNEGERRIQKAQTIKEYLAMIARVTRERENKVEPTPVLGGGKVEIR